MCSFFPKDMGGPGGGGGFQAKTGLWVGGGFLQKY